MRSRIAVAQENQNDLILLFLVIATSTRED